jgi:hypothetical protein
LYEEVLELQVLEPQKIWALLPKMILVEQQQEL